MKAVSFIIQPSNGMIAQRSIEPAHFQIRFYFHSFSDLSCDESSQLNCLLNTCPASCHRDECTFGKVNVGKEWSGWCTMA